MSKESNLNGALAAIAIIAALTVGCEREKLPFNPVGTPIPAPTADKGHSRVTEPTELTPQDIAAREDAEKVLKLVFSKLFIGKYQISPVTEINKIGVNNPDEYSVHFGLKKLPNEKGHLVHVEKGYGETRITLPYGKMTNQLPPEHDGGIRDKKTGLDQKDKALIARLEETLNIPPDTRWERRLTITDPNFYTYLQGSGTIGGEKNVKRMIIRVYSPNNEPSYLIITVR
ncbi:MAG: hypothetical protein ABIC96_04110 [Patescibacteria group bacterium]